MKHAIYCHLRHRKSVKWSEDYEAYYLPNGLSFPTEIYFGERIIYLTPGIDHNTGGGWRGNLSDSWPCYSFGFDLKSALEWLHDADDKKEDTLSLWTKDLFGKGSCIECGQSEFDSEKFCLHCGRGN